MLSQLAAGPIRAAFIVVSAVLLTSVTADAQEANKTPIPLNMVWRAQIAPGDYLDTLSRTEYDTYASTSGLAYYLPQNNTGGDPSIYRQRNTSTGQTTPSNFNPIGGNTLDGRIGYGFASAGKAVGGLTPIARLYNSGTGDRFLALPGETKAGYTTESMSGYGFARNLTNNEFLVGLTGGGVTIQSNLNTGGALWNWTHNGKQYINTRDYGRQIQTSYIAQNDKFLNGSNQPRIINPTEAGSRHSDLSIATSLRQGSPVVSAFNNGLTQRTRSVPLEWDPDQFGGDANHPLMWNDAELGKNITLDYGGRGALAQYQTVLRPAYTSKSTAIEVPTGYLTGDFNRYYTYDAGKAAGTRAAEVTPPVNTGAPTDGNVQFTPASGFGGVIISTTDQQYAMGVYGATVAHGGSIDYFTLWNFTSLGGTGEFDGGTSKWSAAYGPDGAFGRNGAATLLAGNEYTFTSWITTGTLAEVEAQMDWLKSQNALGAIQVVAVPEPAAFGLIFAASTLVMRRRSRQR